MNYKEVINKWKLNQALLASLIDMPAGTFKNKFSDNQKSYNFTSDEEKAIIKNLVLLGKDINSIDTNIALEQEKENAKKVAKLLKENQQVIVNDLNKASLGEKPYIPDNPRFKIVNGKKVFK